ncbi:1-phosphatidylinositol-3-phosphate 5-kinase Fab1 [Schizosaccharomyces japonicus yFS275]|uniref:1-phosphatidylinositol-3-phosphate 5-kinase n=1 Tax=Schizosaccharomyces japonicus (strain yFS275 / FY16936) TaxID=402676 RepID=B6JW68_SCHJY|nr:1-phosphatidylinositol-3-phosphate 5-kinase Fab1 [Schizosaccharomyces japonicus yFS275]EEB05619.1 1-phosphatidylinositol-3-phosphate 5-kinase Fab1 [Schizosaccharomyces japonicus yFS275]
MERESSITQGHFRHRRKRSARNSRLSGSLIRNAYSHSPFQVTQSLLRLRDNSYSKNFWMKDSSALSCFLCEAEFTAIRRRHHCRICGKIFCSKCTIQVSGKLLNTTKSIRACITCARLAEQNLEIYSQVNTAPTTASNQKPLKNDQNTSAALAQKVSSSDNASSFEMPVDARPPDIAPMLAIPSTKISDPSFGWSHQIITVGWGKNASDTNLPSRIHSPSPARNSSNSLGSGHSLYNATSSGLYSSINPLESPKRESSKLANSTEEHPALTEFNLKSLSASQYFGLYGKDGMNSSLSDSSSISDSSQSNPGCSSADLNPGGSATTNNSNLASNFTLDTFNNQFSKIKKVFNNCKAWFQGVPPEPSTDDAVPADESNESSPVQEPTSARSVSWVTPWAAISHDYETFIAPFLDALLLQLLTGFNYEEQLQWQKTLSPIILNVAKNIHPDIRFGDDIDVRNYVKIKRIPGGSIPDTSYISGYVFTKKSTLKMTEHCLCNPKIAIIAFSLDYQCDEQRLMSLDSIINQEQEYLLNLVNRICTLGANLLFIRDLIPGLALDYLKERGVVAVHGIKDSVLFELSRRCGADIIPSIDRLAFQPRLGSCKTFEIKSFVVDPHSKTRKSYIIVDGCLEQLGCSVILRGGNLKVLSRIKEIVQLLSMVSSHLKLEIFMLRDSFVQLQQDMYSYLADATIFKPPDVKSSSSEAFGPASTAGKSEEGTDIETGEQQSMSVSRVSSSESLSSSDSSIQFFNDTQIITNSFCLEDIPSPIVLEDVNDYDLLLNKLSKQLVCTSPFVKQPLPNLLYRVSGARLTFIRLLQEFKLKLPNSVKLSRALDYTNPKLNNIELLQLAYRVTKAKEDYEVYAKHWETYFTSTYTLYSPFSDQRIILLFSIMNKKTSVPCVGPERCLIEFYRETDCTLGQFIEESCLNAKSNCDGDYCTEQEMLNHYRSYVHGNGRISIFLEYFLCPLPGLEERILMWSYCRICQRNTPITLMSDGTWRYSFGKYLQFIFYNRSLTGKSDLCSHSLMRDHVHYFGFKNFTVRFQRDNIDVYELCFPKPRILAKPKIENNLKEAEYKNIRTQITQCLQSVLLRINHYKLEWTNKAGKVDEGKELIAKLSEQLENDKREVEAELNNIYKRSGLMEQLPLNAAIRLLQRKMLQWETQLMEFEKQHVPSYKDISRLAASQLKKLFTEKNLTQDPTEPVDIPTDTTASDVEKPKKTPTESDVNSETPPEIVIPRAVKPPVLRSVSAYKPVTETPPSLSRSLSLSRTSTNERDHRSPEGDVNVITQKRPCPKIRKQQPGPSPAASVDTNSNSPKLVMAESQPSSAKRPSIKRNYRLKESRVSALVKRFEEFSKELHQEKKKEFDLINARRKRASAVVPSKPTVEVFSSVTDAFRDDNSEVEVNDDSEQPSEQNSEPTKKDPEPSINEASPSHDILDLISASDPLEDIFGFLFKDDSYTQHSAPSIGSFESQESGHLSIPSSSLLADNNSLVKIISSFWSEWNNLNFPDLEFPLTASEHIFSDSTVIIREREPSSIIAFTLSSSDYLEKLSSIKAKLKTEVNDENYMVSDMMTLETLMLKSTGTHLKYQFEEGSAKMSCKVYFAEQFDAIREVCKCASTYIESLSRCSSWESSGGKSGSAFLKTADDRFVLKQLSRMESDAFLTFAPAYFEYMSKAFFHELPTVLAKIFGFYQIETRNQITGYICKLDIMIMENLFFDRVPTRIFDLKGSMRNRHVQSTGKVNEVLLDENLVEFIYESPLFIAEQMKSLLQAALWNDTLFLSKMNIMDYSLVIGIDETKRRLYVGIIDFIRTYTWDKKLESWVKEKGLVGRALEPTIVTPKQYKNRFRKAMDCYILATEDYNLNWVVD